MRNLYFIRMLSLYPFIVFLDMLFLLTAKDWKAVNIATALIMEATIYGALNLIGAWVIFKPIDKFIQGTGDFEGAQRLIARLSLYSALWIAALGFLYSIPVYIFSVMYGEISYPISGPLLHIYLIFGLLLTYCVYCSIFGYFVIESFCQNLKAYLFEHFALNFPPGGISISRKLAMIYVLFLCVSAVTLFDLIASGILVNVEKHQMVIVDLVLSLTLVLFVFIFSRGLKGPLENLLSFFAGVRAGNFKKRMPVISNDELGIISANFNRTVAALEERELIRNAFGKYVSRGAAEEIIKKNGYVSGENRFATALFTDIENYTATTEKMSPSAVVELLNEYFTALVQIVTDNGGLVNKFMGDSILAFFNILNEDERHAASALRTALQIQATMNERFFGNGVRLRTRIGINSGDMVVGTVGAKERMEFTALGDTVNTASRLEALNKSHGTYILAGESTVQAAGEGEFNFENIGSMEIRGKSQNVGVYRVLGFAMPR